LLRLHYKQQTRFVELIGERYPAAVEFYAPVYKRLCRPHGRRRPIAVVQPIWLGYLFARSDLAAGFAHHLTHTPIRVSWVRFGGQIETVPDAVIDQLRILEARNELVREEMAPHPYRVGAKVRVHLPVASIDAVVVRLINGHSIVADTSLGTLTARVSIVTVL
jgi:hypothetical protein